MSNRFEKAMNEDDINEVHHIHIWFVMVQTALDKDRFLWSHFLVNFDS